MTRLADGRGVLVVALVIGLVVRLAILSQTSTLGTAIVDEQHYAQLATNLLNGHGFGWGPGQLTSIRPPLYPALLASIWAVGGEGNLQAVRMVQIALALFTVALVYALGRRVFGPRAAAFGAALFWLYPSLAFFNFTIMTETLFCLLLLGFLFLVVMLVQGPRLGTALACGAVLGLSALARSVLWPLPLVLCPLLLVVLRVQVWRRVTLALLVLIGYSVVVGPWAIRNTRLQGVVTIVDTMGGINLRLGNYEHTPDDRMWAAVDLMTGEKSWSYALQQQYPGQKFTEGQKDKWAQGQAVEYMLAHPWTTLRRACIKFADFWGLEREFIAMVRYGVFAPPAWVSTVVGAAVVLAFVAVALAGTAGVWLSAPEWRLHVLLLLPAILITGVHTVVFGHSRYHIPLVPVLALYAAAIITSPRRSVWPASGWAWWGAATSMTLLAAIWIRQLVFADAGRLSALLGLGG